RASLQAELGQLAETDALSRARTADLRRLREALAAADDELSETRAELMDGQSVEQEPVSTISEGAGARENAQSDNSAPSSTDN
ncbi:hypothetical protein DFP92_11819, partial [Yoonia sediminilitoris]